MDNRFKEFDNCRIMSVYEKKLSNIKDSGSYLIEVAIDKEDSCFSDYIDIKVDKHNIYNDLEELISGKVERVYLAHGMADIDIYKSHGNKKYCIKWSPNELSYNYMYFEEKNFMMEFVNALKPNAEKEY